jgi:hypothetical protein
MPTPPSYQHLLETSRRVNWRLSDLLGEGRRLDFTRPFLPETFAQTEPLGFLSPAEKLKLNRIRARGYLALFELVEAFVVQFMSGQSNDAEEPDAFRAPALHQFVDEEQKHRELFRAVLREFDREFGTPCGLIGPAEEICRAILSHGPLAITIVTLGLEWMSQGHYLGSIKDHQDLDPQFKSLLKHHWIEEAQHTKLDGRVLKSLADRSSPQDMATAIGRSLSEDERQQFLEAQHGALRRYCHPRGKVLTSQLRHASVPPYGSIAHADGSPPRRFPVRAHRLAVRGVGNPL